MAIPHSQFPEVDLDDYLYDLPKERIAQYPLEKRDSSKLLCYRNGEISHYQFHDIPDLLPSGSSLFFNNTRVIPARIFFRRKTGARIEVFLLEPLSPFAEVEQAMNVHGETTWKCLIRNIKKWKEGEILELPLIDTSVLLRCELISREKMVVKLKWEESNLTFSELLTQLGKIPLPPYMNRDTEELDRERYQTIYSRIEGAVAAPTAGLHFTGEVLKKLEEKDIKSHFLTLHVSSGTFQPIKTTRVSEHPMHAEQITLSRENVKQMLESTFRIAVGTTSLRTMESIYWFGVQLDSKESKTLHIRKDAPYRLRQDVTVNQSLNTVLDFMVKHDIGRIHGITEIFIVPGYQIRTVDALVTNFHIPGSTLMLLVGAFIDEKWKDVYNEALANDYRFLSYGDSSLLFR